MSTYRVGNVREGMPEEVLFETESRKSRAEVAAYLRSVADRLDEDGAVSLTAGDQSVDLAVPDAAEFEVKVERETPAGGGTGELSLELEIEWNEGGGDDGSLSIE